LFFFKGIFPVPVKRGQAQNDDATISTIS